MQRISQHPLLNQRLFLFSDLSDAELQHCYRGARGVIFPSVVEGFGLPIVESLWFGKRTFVSDTPIHREVGEEDCCYFDLEDPHSLVSEIVRWESEVNVGHELDLPTRKPTGWRASTEQLMEHCLQALMAHGRAQEGMGKAA
jgi:glycosyltransferase involved in cell wall biosynthesis